MAHKFEIEGSKVDVIDLLYDIAHQYVQEDPEGCAYLFVPSIFWGDILAEYATGESEFLALEEVDNRFQLGPLDVLVAPGLLDTEIVLQPMEDVVVWEEPGE